MIIYLIFSTVSQLFIYKVKTILTFRKNVTYIIIINIIGKLCVKIDFVTRPLSETIFQLCLTVLQRAYQFSNPESQSWNRIQMSHKNNIFFQLYFCSKKNGKTSGFICLYVFLFDWFFCIPTFYKRLTVFANFNRIFLSEKKINSKKKTKLKNSSSSFKNS